MKRAVFLDRDGVLNRAVIRQGKPYPPSTPAELELLPGVEPALKRLKENAFLLIVVTNQPDVARGAQRRETVEAMNSFLGRQLPLDQFCVCYHDDTDNCSCRKPKPGLLTSAAIEWDVDLSSSYMVGDRWRDVDAGAAAGCRTVWIDCGYSERPPRQAPHARVRDLTEAADWILRDAQITQGKQNESVS